MPRLAAFGGLALLGDDGPFVGAAARGRNLALLALLARAGAAGVAREKLAAYLWSESDAERSRHSLDQALYTLRRALGADAFVTGATTIALDHRVVTSDVVGFTRAFEAGAMLEAADAYAGPFLDGFHLSDAAEFERWVDGERAVLHAQYVAALESLAREATAAGDHAAAVRHWRRLAAVEPLSSRIALGLMHALAAAGDRAGALQASAVHTALVREELDVAPDPAVRAYVEELRREAERATAPSGAGHPGASPDPAPAHASDIAGTTSPTAFVYGVRPGGRRSRRARIWGAAALAAVTILAGWTLLARRDASADPALARVAVAPFENETGDASLDPLGRMAADWITEGLVRTGLVQVIEPGAAARAATSVVSGRIYLVGDTVWFQARITRPDSGLVLQALDAVGAVAGSSVGALEPLRQQVLGALGTLYDPRLSAWAGKSHRPPTYAAYQEFATGVELHAVPRDLAGAAEHFRRAAELDPDYVLPRLWLAWAWIMSGDYARADSISRALEADRARMSPVDRAWHDRIAALLAGDNEASYRAAKRMNEIAPRSGTVMALANTALDTNRPGVTVAMLENGGIERVGLEREHAWFLLTAAYHMLGEYRREMETAERAIRSDGLDWGYTGPGVPALAALGRLDALELRLQELRNLPPLDDGVPREAAALLAAVVELRAHGFEDDALALVDRRLAREPESLAGGAVAGPARWARVQLLYQLGRWDEAERALGAPPDDERVPWRHRAMAGLIAAHRGDTEAPRRAAAALGAMDTPYLFGEPTFWRARIAAVLGEEENAIALLRQAFAEGQHSRVRWLLHVGRDFDALRDSDAFRELVRVRS